MYTRRCLVVGLLAASCLAAQDARPTLQVTGVVEQPLTLSADDLAKMPRASVKLENGGGTYEGVWLHEILKKAGAPLGERLRGKALTTYVLAEAKDGYQVIFSIGEVDPSFTSSQILLADKRNGGPLDPDQGPFRLVVASDKPGARSVRMLVRLEIVQVKK